MVKNRLLNMLTLIPTLTGEIILIGNFLFYKKILTPGVDQDIGNNHVSGDVFTGLYYGYLVSITFFAIVTFVLITLSWKDKNKALLVISSLSNSIEIFVILFLLLISRSVFPEAGLTLL
jgi:hypothetical protein